jgi:hypothetical protein
MNQMNANKSQELPALATPVCEIIVAEQVETIDRSIEQTGQIPLVQSIQNTTLDKKRNRDDNTDNSCCFVYLCFLCQSDTIKEYVSSCSNTCQCCFEAIGNMDCDCDDN